MSIAREQFRGRIKAISEILTNPISTDNVPVPVPSSVAVTIRNGCMVMLFCALEGFIRTRSLECANLLNQGTVPYSHLPEGLKYTTLVSSFEGLVYQTKYWSNTADKIAEFEKVATAVASGALGSPYQFTEYSFAKEKSNVGSKDVAEIAKNFHVENFWNSATRILSTIGITYINSLSDIFRELSKERNRAAHVPTNNIAHNTLGNFLPQTASLAFAFDILISAGTAKLNSSSLALGFPSTKISDTNINFITVKARQDGKWILIGSNPNRALLVKHTEAAATAAALIKIQNTAKSIACKNSAGQITNWVSVIG